MDTLINVYCDESCHLERDRQPSMVLGAVFCKAAKTREVAERIREIKERHGLPRAFEAKWTKVSPAKVDFFRDVIDYFFDDDDLHFRALIANKSRLRHGAFAQSHDDRYYKMYFNLLKAIFSPDQRYHIYLDIKDTRGAEKVERLHDILCNSIYDFNRTIIGRLQLVRSHEVEQMQVADLLIGAVGYANRVPMASTAKRALVERVRKRSGYSLTSTTLLREQKLNLFHWKPQEPRP